MDAHFLKSLALYMPALLLSLAVHEYAHAWMATRLGDPTPARQGRLTLSPLAHMDPIGSVLFPIGLLLMTGGFFGWAKPVEYNPANFSRRLSMRQGAALTAAMGPASNILLALVAVVSLRVCLTMGIPIEGAEGGLGMLTGFLRALFVLNILLAVFNLIPLPPLDGSHFLPRALDDLKDFLTRYSFFVFLLVFFVPLPGLGGSLGNWLMSPFLRMLEDGLIAIASVGS